MKSNSIKHTLFLSFGMLVLGLSACKKDEIQPASAYETTLSCADMSASFPDNETLNNLTKQYANKGILGISLSIHSPEGQWLGAGGYADVVSNIPMEPGHRFFIGSISKVFTATAIFHYVDEGTLSIEDPVNKWIDAEVCDQIANANESKISDLLSHQSGIKDWYVIALEMARSNNEINNWEDEEILEYVYGKKAEFAVGEQFGYSNTNYVLLGMILEKASGKSLGEVYSEVIFNPLGLNSADYISQKGFEESTAVKGYMDLYGTNTYTESQFLYRDEMGTGDGGISINAQDLTFFMEALMEGEIISETSLAAMQNWFDISGYGDQIKNGYGLEYSEDEYGVYIGHTGGVDGFSSLAYYFPEQETHLTILVNYISGTEEAYRLSVDFLDEIKKVVLA